jgi:hypothetical protein
LTIGAFRVSLPSIMTAMLLPNVPRQRAAAICPWQPLFVRDRE